MKKIIFFNSSEQDINYFKQVCENKYEPIFTKSSINDFGQFSDEMKEAEVISCFTISKLTPKILSNFKNLKLVALRCVGFNNVDIEYCKKNSISVVNANGYGNRTVAEFALALMLDVTRNVSQSYISLIDNKRNFAPSGYELDGKTLGVIGVGSIGAELVKIAHNIGMNVLGYDIKKNEDLEKNYNIRYVELNELLKESDYISIHAPLTKENYHLINDEKFSLMKESAILINTARGEIIDTKALYKALSFETIKGAGLDVLECEEMSNNANLMYDMDYLDKKTIKQILLNHEITKLANAVVTPHIAYDTQEAKKRIQEITMSNIDSFFEGNIKNSVY